MDRGMLIDYYHQAAQHVRQGLVHVQKQKSLIADIEAQGRDGVEATSLLKKFEEMLDLYRSDLKRLQKALADVDAA